MIPPKFIVTTTTLIGGAVGLFAMLALSNG